MLHLSFVAQAQMQALAAVQAQAQLQRQMLAQQQALFAAVPAVVNPAAALVAAAAAGGATVATGPAVDSTTARKSREVYIGNLAIGAATPEMLTELFNAALVGMVSDPILEPPVINVKMDNTGQHSMA
jgi:splicing factor U2AF subunit